MPKTNIILLVIVALLVGFILGAITGIKFSSTDIRRPVAEKASDFPEPPRVVSGEDIARYEDILKKDPNNLNALISLGNLYFDSNQHQKAINMYGQALKIDPKNADVRTDMAVMYRNMKDFDRAVKELKEAAAHDPKHANSRFNLGVVLLHDKNDLKGAIAAWEDLLKVEPASERSDTIRQQLQQLRAMAK